MTFTEQTGYKRSGPNAICQDTEVLLAVREFSFDLKDEDFVRYFEDRTGVRITWSPRCGYEHPFACSEKEWAKVCADILVDDDTHDRILRGKLEDAWELWQAELERERGTRSVARIRGAFPARNVPATKQAATTLAAAEHEPQNIITVEFDRDEYVVCLPSEEVAQ
jgi:hypothetical protein